MISKLVDDRGHSDSMSLIGQLGAIRTLALGIELLTRRVQLPKGALGAR
ncbi:MAG: hypothetical protein ACRDL5_14460 [Solirubrobacteraceae bacterium]